MWTPVSEEDFAPIRTLILQPSGWPPPLTLLLAVALSFRKQNHISTSRRPPSPLRPLHLLAPPTAFSLSPIFAALRGQGCFREEGSAVVPEASIPTLGEPMDLMTALQLVMKKSLAHDGLARGLHEGAKVIEKHAAQLCLLAEDCDQPDYVKLVKALCAEHNVHLITVPNAKTLGEWAGLCKIDSEGKARKVVGCSCIVVKDYGEESEGLHIVQEYVKSH
ncbi:hypothetical protein Taro_040571 [Colocasia esculenta]|uniref:40S ribosomal protein S12 n=1 Tax=Colocasia esculenta TaxID=4460 RepID=A0A843WQU0_COLES|nr:hypothetical protein [Colocasia esculenta]